MGWWPIELFCQLQSELLDLLGLGLDLLGGLGLGLGLDNNKRTTFTKGRERAEKEIRYDADGRNRCKQIVNIMIDYLPAEIFLHIALYLTFDSIKKCREVSSSWKTQIENSGLLKSAVLVIGPENEKLVSESKLFTIVNKIRITKFRREQSDTVNGILKKINHCSLKYLSVDCCVNMDSTLLIPFFSSLSEIHLTGSTIRDTVLVILMDEFVHKSDFSLNTLTLDCRVINTPISKAFSSLSLATRIDIKHPCLSSIFSVNVRIEIEHISASDHYVGIIKITDRYEKIYLRPSHLSFVLDKKKRRNAGTAGIKIDLNGRNSKTLFFNLLAHEHTNVKAIHTPILHSKKTGSRRSQYEESKISHLNVQLAKR